MIILEDVDFGAVLNYVLLSLIYSSVEFKSTKNIFLQNDKKDESTVSTQTEHFDPDKERFIAGLLH